MAQQQQDEEWPLGVHSLTARGIGLSSSSSATTYGSGYGGGGFISLSTLLSVSSDNSSTDSSSDLDSQTTTKSSFFHERITTFGRFIGTSSTLDLHKRPTNRREGRKAETFDRNCSETKPKFWFFSVCRSSSDVEVVESAAAAPPLSHFLAAERRRRQSSKGVTGPYYDGVGLLYQSSPESNSLFVDGRVAPPRAALTSEGGKARGNSSVLLSSI